jgi:predicted nuclease of predicted toxin-antitoxin system
LVVSTGNIGNDDLLMLFVRHLGAIVDAFAHAGLVELHRDHLVVHEA